MEHNSNEDSGQSPGAIDICPVCDAIGMLCELYPNYRLCVKLRVHLNQNYLFFHLAPECAKKALHYGGICCYSCRAFFRRAHQNTKTPAFICRTSSHGVYMGLSSPMSPNGEISESGTQSSKQCGYDVTTKRQCQFHRLQRCLEIGIERVLENN